MKLFLNIFLIFIILNASSPYQVVKIGKSFSFYFFKKEIKLKYSSPSGGLFFNNELDILEAFDAAINDVNALNTDFRLEPVKHFLGQDDSIILQQLSELIFCFILFTNLKIVFQNKLKNVVFFVCFIACDLMDQGVVAIFGPSSKTTSGKVFIFKFFETNKFPISPTIFFWCLWKQ